MTTGRTYGGETAEDRLARRRRQLLDAGLQVFGTTGYRQATVRQLCREARVTDRYFYEQFDSTEDLLAAVYDVCLDRLQAAAVAGVERAAGSREGAGVGALARAGLDGFLGVVQDDPRLARVVWFEVLGVSPRVEALYLGRMRAFADLLVALSERAEAPAALDGDDVTVRTLADAAVGGISHCVLGWAAAGFATAREPLVEALARFLEATSVALVSPPTHEAESRVLRLE